MVGAATASTGGWRDNLLGEITEKTQLFSKLASFQDLALIKTSHNMESESFCTVLVSRLAYTVCQIVSGTITNLEFDGCERAANDRKHST